MHFCNFFLKHYLGEQFFQKTARSLSQKRFLAGGNVGEELFQAEAAC